MTDWSLAAELSAFIVMFVIYLFAEDRTAISSRRRRLFMSCLGLGATSIALNVICTVSIMEQMPYPYALNMALNTAYFFTSTLMSSLLALYLLDLMLEHVHDPHYRKASFYYILGVTLAFDFLLVANLTFAPGIIFNFNEAGEYSRGPLGQIGYLVPLLETVLLFVFYFRNRKNVARHFIRVVRLLPPIVIALVMFQIAFPSLLLNGTIFSVALLIVFINFQSTRVETDSLTRLGTRTSFHEDLETNLEHNIPFQVITVSLIDFASVNRRWGYKTGDEVIYKIAAWLERFDRAGRTYRYGKVSFCVMRPCESREDADKAFESIRERFDAPWSFGKESRCISVTCTDIVCDTERWPSVKMITYLDALREVAKQTHARALRFDEEFKQRVDHGAALAEILKETVESKNFRICYQPIMNCSTGRFDRAEALMRLEDANGKPVSPEELVALAEATGLIGDVTDIVLEKTCHFLAQHPDLPIDAVAVNLSMPQLLNPMLCEHILSLLENHGVAATRLRVEITERLFGEDQQIVETAIEKLNRAGIGCYLDDFGIGYSNLAAVMHLPFECVKIDRSILADVIYDERSKRIVSNIVIMLHSMGLSIVAEGVETGEQAEFLSSLKVERMQGYHFSRPLEEQDFLDFLENR